MNKENKDAVHKIQQFLLVLYKDFKLIEFDEETINLKEIAENGLASAIGAMEMTKLSESKK